MPTRSLVLGSQPMSFLMSVLSLLRPLTPFGGLEVVGAFELDAGDFLDDVDELVDGDQFVAADVDRFDDVAPEEVLGALEAIGDIHEGAGLVAVAPDFDFVFAGEFGLDDLAANGGGGFFAAAVVGAVGAVDVVIAGDAGDEAEIFAEMAAHAFAEELFPAVAVFGQGGIGVLFLQGGDVFVALLVGVVDAGAGGVEIALDAVFLGGHAEVRVDQHAEHAEGAVVFDEAHAAHVGGEVIDDFGALERFIASGFFLEIELEVFDVGEFLIPLVEGFDVDGADVGVALGEEVGHEMTADETAGAADDNFVSRISHDLPAASSIIAENWMRILVSRGGARSSIVIRPNFRKVAAKMGVS